MNTIFNFNRIALLIQRHFTERFRSEIIYWSIMTIVFVLIRNQLPMIYGLILIAGVFYAARFFREIHSRTNGINYFMIPATQLEKTIVPILLCVVYYFGMMVIAYTIGNLLGTGLNNLLANINIIPFPLGFTHTPLKWCLFESTQDSLSSLNIFGSHFENTVGSTLNVCSIFLTFLKMQSIFILGGIYFKNNQTIKTLLALSLIGFTIGILILIEIKLILNVTSIQLGTIGSGDFLSVLNTIRTLFHVLFYYLMVPFCWVVSYFRLTEKEV